MRVILFIFAAVAAVSAAPIAAPGRATNIGDAFIEVGKKTIKACQANPDACSAIPEGIGANNNVAADVISGIMVFKISPEV
ncbi:hypothetical protein ABW20_dc0108574 [Dactylellina cionopaga]|nr:hypothetical protein ABW20_dc0108574 [Dactylellina cionopaga]